MEHNRIKQRIVGGVILISIAVIILPMILSESGEREISGSNIPEKPGYLVKTEIIPLEIKDLSAPEETIQRQVIEPAQIEVLDESAIDEQNEQNEQVKENLSDHEKVVVPVVADKKQVAPVVEKQTPQVEPASRVAVSGWVVQVGSFSSELNAFGLRDKLRNKGYSAFVERAEGSKVVFRVRVGPEIKQEKAQRVKGELMDEMKLDGLVMRHR